MSCSQVDREYVRHKKALQHYKIPPYKPQHISHGSLNEPTGSAAWLELYPKHLPREALQRTLAKAAREAASAHSSASQTKDAS